MTDSQNPYANTQHMHTVHATFRREFALLPGLVREVAPGDDVRARVIAEHIRLLALSLHEHHSGEDAVLYPRLAIRASKESDPVIRFVDGQHATINALITDIEAHLNTWATSAGADDRDGLAAGLQRFVPALYEHLDLEEKLILPLVERYVFASEYKKMVEDGAATIPREVGPVLAGMIMYEGGIEALPAEMRAILAEVAPRAYAAYAEKLYGTPTPPRSSDMVLGTPDISIRSA